MHVLSDTGDTVGCMLLFPWTHHFTLGAWAYARQTGRIPDAAAYYSGLGLRLDALWVVLALACWPVLRRSYFFERVVPSDGFWSWTGAAALRRRPARGLPRRRLLRRLPLRDLDALDARAARLPLRPDLGRPALGARGASSNERAGTASTASTRRCSSGSSSRPSLRKIAFTCDSTVLGLSTSRVAMPAFETPSAISASTSRSRGVSSRSGSRSRRRPISCPTTSGSTTVPPRPTRRADS